MSKWSTDFHINDSIDLNSIYFTFSAEFDNVSSNYNLFGAFKKNLKGKMTKIFNRIMPSLMIFNRIMPSLMIKPSLFNRIMMAASLDLKIG